MKAPNSPRIVNQELFWFDGNTFDIHFKITPYLNGEDYIPQEKDKVTVTFHNANTNRWVHTVNYPAPKDGYITLVVDSDVTKLFREGAYYMDIVYYSDYETTICSHYDITVEPTLPIGTSVPFNRTIEHGDLDNRMEPDQHNVESIRGLQPALLTIVADLTREDSSLTDLETATQTFDINTTLELSKVTAEVSAARKVFNSLKERLDPLDKAIDDKFTQALMDSLPEMMDVTEFETRIAEKADKEEVDALWPRVFDQDSLFNAVQRTKIPALESASNAAAWASDLSSLEATQSSAHTANIQDHAAIMAEVKAGIDYVVAGVHDAQSIILQGTSIQAENSREGVPGPAIPVGYTYHNLEEERLESTTYNVLGEDLTSSTRLTLRHTHDTADYLSLDTGQHIQRLAECNWNGSEEWWLFHKGDSCLIFYNPYPPEDGDLTKACRTSTLKQLPSLWGDEQGLGLSEAGYFYICLAKTNLEGYRDDCADWELQNMAKAWLTAHPTKVYYNLKQPIDTTISITPLYRKEKARGGSIQQFLLEGNYYQDLENGILECVTRPTILTKNIDGATAYSNNYIVDLRKVGDVSDTLDLVTGKVTKRIGTQYEWTGAVNWQLHKESGIFIQNSHSFCVVAKNSSTSVGFQTSICSGFENVNQAWLNTNTTKMYSDHHSVQDKYFRLLKTDLVPYGYSGGMPEDDLLQVVKTYFNHNPVKVYYKLATPEEYYINVPHPTSLENFTQYLQTQDVKAQMLVQYTNKYPDYLHKLSTLAASLAHGVASRQQTLEQRQADLDFMLMLTEEET